MALPNAHFPWVCCPHPKNRDPFAEYGSHVAVDMHYEDGKVKAFPQKLHQVEAHLYSNQAAIPYIPPNFVPCPWDDRCMNDLQKKRKSLAELYHRIAQKAKEVRNLKHARIADVENNIRRLQIAKETGHESDIRMITMMLPNEIRCLVNDVQQHINDKILPMVSSKYTGGCLGFCSAPDTSIGTLIYPSGQKLGSIVFDQVTSESMGIKRLDNWSQIEVSGDIHEVTTSHYMQCAVRTPTDIQLFSAESDYDGWERLDGLKVEAPSSVALSPFIKGEILVADELGTVRCWKSGSQPVVVCNKVGTRFECSENWRHCHFGAHPRLGVLADRSGVRIFDMRAKNDQDMNDLFMLPCRYLHVKERVMATRQHPENNFYHFVATDYSLALVDERFLNVPVLQWSHGLLTPPQYMDIVPSVDVDGTKEDILLLSSQESCETNCFPVTFNKGSQSEDCFAPQSSCLFWRCARISDFTRFPDVDGADKAVIEQRLIYMSQMGMCGARHLNGNGMSVFQMNSLGDVVCQPFYPTTDDKVDKTFSAGPGSRDLKLSEGVIVECVAWLKELQRQVDLTPIVKDETKMYDALSSLGILTVRCYSHVGCRLCMPLTSACVDLTSLTEEDVCMACGIKLNIGQKLNKSYQSGELLCLEKAEDITTDLDFLPSIDVTKYKDPDSQILLKEWEEDGEILNLLKERDELRKKDKEEKMNRKKERSKQNKDWEFGTPNIPLPMKTRECLFSSSSKGSSKASPSRTPGFLSTPPRLIQQSLSPTEPSRTQSLPGSPLKLTPLAEAQGPTDETLADVFAFMSEQITGELFEINTTLPSATVFSNSSQTAVDHEGQMDEAMVTPYGDLFDSSQNQSQFPEQSYMGLGEKELHKSSERRKTSPKKSKKSKKSFVMGF